MNRLIPLLLLLISSVTLAESGAYRVEVIVVQNLKVAAEPAAIEELRSFSQFPDTREPEQTPEPAASPVEELPGDSPPAFRGDLPDDMQVLGERSDYMNDVWRRLRSSADYRPLLYTAWEQNRVDYYPPMHVHDQNIIETQMRPPTHIMVADLGAEDPLAAYRSDLYQLDGSVQLRRSRFLHLFLDIEYRQKEPLTEPVFSLDTAAPGETGTATEPEHGAVWNVFSLKQNRQIRTGELQYFDTPYFGALVLVSAISAK